jgi:hypothetical protein
MDNPVHALYRAAQAADDDFQRELVRLYGANAGDMRYRPRKWPTGSCLTELSKAFQEAQEAYLTACRANTSG